MNILIDCVRMVTELTVAVPTEQQIAEYAFLAVFRLWCAAFGFGYERLYLFEITPCNNRLVNILEYCPILRIVRKSCFVLKRLRTGLEVDYVTAVFLLRQNLLNCCLAPFVWIRLCFLSASRQTFRLQANTKPFSRALGTAY